MNMNIRMRAGIALILFAVTGGGVAAGADTIVALSVKREGTFEGFDNARILFRSANGRLQKQQFSQVSKLTLESPLNVTITMKGAKMVREDAVCKGFEKAKFIFAQNGKSVEKPADKIAKIEIRYSDNQLAQSVSVEPIDTDALIADPSGQPPSPAQSAAIRQYKEAWTKYKTFADETEKLKSEMDQATGARRSAVIDQLRIKKHEERGILDELGKAEDMLTAAFPALKQ